MLTYLLYVPCQVDDLCVGYDTRHTLVFHGITFNYVLQCLPSIKSALTILFWTDRQQQAHQYNSEEHSRGFHDSSCSIPLNFGSVNPSQFMSMSCNILKEKQGCSESQFWERRLFWCSLILHGPWLIFSSLLPGMCPSITSTIHQLQQSSAFALSSIYGPNYSLFSAPHYQIPAPISTIFDTNNSHSRIYISDHLCPPAHQPTI